MVYHHYYERRMARELPRANKKTLRAMARTYFYAIYGEKWPNAWHVQNYWVWEAFRQAGLGQYWAATEHISHIPAPPEFTDKPRYEGPESLNELAMICAWFLTIKEFDLGSIDPRTIKRWQVDLVTKRLEGK
jgi:hypothetical protein